MIKEITIIFCIIVLCPSANWAFSLFSNTEIYRETFSTSGDEAVITFGKPVNIDWIDIAEVGLQKRVSGVDTTSTIQCNYTPNRFLSLQKTNKEPVREIRIKFPTFRVAGYQKSPDSTIKSAREGRIYRVSWAKSGMFCSRVWCKGKFLSPSSPQIESYIISSGDCVYDIPGALTDKVFKEMEGGKTKRRNRKAVK